ncbi:DUF4340 domain-containing protein [Azospirillum sp. ST 5-10]|uniref:DUF4340 domain-containing protein n=1 Tax=unclassified Azospirillum TaxID=2630922 RepID=UPI003F4A8108
MRTRSLAILAVATALTVAAAGVAVTRKPAGVVDAPAAGPLFPDLEDRINDVARVEITSSKGTVTVARAGQGPWMVQEKDGYAADVDQVKSLVVALAGMTAVEPRTALPDLYPRIGVEPVGPGAASVGVTLSGADDKPLAALLVGKTAAASPGGGTALYVRKPDTAQSWLARASLAPPDTDPLRWLDRAMPQIPRDRVKAVEIRQSDGTVVTLSRPDPQTADFAVTGLAEGTTPRQSTVDETAGALAYLSFEDVRRADPGLFADAPTAIVRTFDGVVLTVRTAVHEDANWLAFAAAFDPEQAAAGAANPALLTPEAAKAQAAEWQARFSGWAYRVFDATADRFRRPPAGFVAK